MKQITPRELIIISLRVHILMDVIVPIFIVIGFKLLCTNARKYFCDFVTELKMVTAKSFSPKHDVFIA